jgi:hypothetical protein
MKAFSARKSTQQKVPIQKHDDSISKESSGRPKLFADTDYRLPESALRSALDKVTPIKLAGNSGAL